MNYLYCPYCKSDLIKRDYEYGCKNGHKIYINPSPCVSVIPIKNKEILLCRRAIEPKKGAIDFIGGFMTVGETVKDAVMRETYEETGLRVKIKDFIGEYTEFNYNSGVTYPFVFTYTVEITDGEPKPNDDVSELFWVELKDIDKLDLTESFASIKPTLQILMEFYGHGASKI